MSAVASESADRGGVLRWVGVNLGLFAATWVGVGSLFAAAIMFSDDSLPSLPGSLGDIATLPFVVVAVVVMAVTIAAVGLLLMSPGVLPGLALYLGGLWWSGRLAPPAWQRALAVTLSPLVVSFLVAGNPVDSLTLSLLAGAAVYGGVARLAPHRPGAPGRGPARRPRSRASMP